MKKKEKVYPDRGFSEKLLDWNRNKNSRQMPWKGEKNPYRVWLSEIILQQTRVEQGLNYYNRFIETFPDVHALANAPETKVFKLWEGLGYYSRCRNLIAAAKYISQEKKGIFPATYDEIKSLKGVGPYTASAISSFVFNLPHAVVDGNVFRVLSRVFGVHKPVDSTEGKKYFTQLANELLDKTQPGVYNQAIMDFGAVVCKPLAPLCSDCVFNKTCYAYLNSEVGKLPVKEKKIKTKVRWFYYLILESGDKIAIRQRTGKDIWQQLFEFPLIESDAEEKAAVILVKAEKLGWLQQADLVIEVSPVIKQQLSHQLIMGCFIRIKTKQQKAVDKSFVWTAKKGIRQYAFPGLINKYLESAGL